MRAFTLSDLRAVTERALEYVVDGTRVESLPNATGVYRFFNQHDGLLYVGKSVDFRARVRAHFQTAKRDPRHHKMMSSVSRIECQTTPGELAALLFESQAVKLEQPLFNRRLRRKQKLWTAQLREDSDGYYSVQPTALENVSLLGHSYGLFANQTSLKQWLRDTVAAQGLCLRRLGLEAGRGPCFGRQIKRCDGACVGDQSWQDYNRNLRDLFDQYQLFVWPYESPIWVKEQTDSRGDEQSPSSMQPWHVFHYWVYLGSFDVPVESLDVSFSSLHDELDRDAYRILLRFLRHARIEIHQFDAEAGGLVAVENQFRSP